MLSSLLKIISGLAAVPPPELQDGEVQISQEDLLEVLRDNAQKWEELKGLSKNPHTYYEQLFSNTVIVHRRGVPPDVERTMPNGIYRHYVKTPEDLVEILRSKSLVEGETEAWSVTNNTKEIFTNVKGIFFTRPGINPVMVGCPDAAGWVDFVIPKETPMFNIPFYSGTNGSVYVVAGAGMPKSTKLPITIVNSSQGLPIIEFQTLNELISKIGGMPVADSLEILPYQLYSWKILLRASDLLTESMQIKPLNDLYHGRLHLLNTAQLAVRIAIGEKMNDPAILKALWYAGVFHDIARDRPWGASHAERSASIAATYLIKNGISPDIANLTAIAILDHAKEKDKDLPLISLIIRDADQLERHRLGSIGEGTCDINRLFTRSAFSIADEVGRYYNPDVATPKEGLKNLSDHIKLTSERIRSMTWKK